MIPRGPAGEDSPQQGASKADQLLSLQYTQVHPPPPLLAVPGSQRSKGTAAGAPWPRQAQRRTRPLSSTGRRGLSSSRDHSPSLTRKKRGATAPGPGSAPQAAVAAGQAYQPSRAPRLARPEHNRRRRQQQPSQPRPAGQVNPAAAPRHGSPSQRPSGERAVPEQTKAQRRRKEPRALARLERARGRWRNTKTERGGERRRGGAGLPASTMRFSSPKCRSRPWMAPSSSRLPPPSSASLPVRHAPQGPPTNQPRKAGGGAAKDEETPEAFPRSSCKSRSRRRGSARRSGHPETKGGDTPHIQLACPPAVGIA